MNDVMMTAHAVERFQERFAGNLSWNGAQERLRRLLRRARFVSVRPGHARLYALQDMRFLIQDGLLITVYRLRWPPPPPSEDLWCSEPLPHLRHCVSPSAARLRA
ncbi:hypothetical protein [Deinococcus sp. QL22]|uniref:hypothetical protein n=1 Tax=Deinococcus sp. QL22 TaxID=2939437 RepID=UPI00201729AD|nr:hypothetical protein [Deinococcus sp. QL22]UQN08800.1 hypothetical protein M1R55_19530 [Deinococcus sp. QL22]